MNINEILEMARDEVVEPETIRQLMPDLSDEDFNSLEAMITIKTSNYPFENFYVFENVVRALNGIVPDTDMLEGSNPLWIWYACEIIQKLRPNMELAAEVIEYIKKVFSDEGIYFLHPYITKDKSTEINNDNWAQIYAATKHKADNGPYPIEANSFINRQAIELMKMEVYSLLKENKK